MIARRLILAGLAWLCALAGGALVYSAPALAVRGAGSETSFGHAGSGDGEFSEPTSVAVNSSSGDVYVVDKGNDRVEYFTPAGNYIGQFNGSATPAGSFSPESMAVDSSTNLAEDPSAGDVYVVDTALNLIDKFSATGTYLSQLTGFSNTVLGIAINSHGLWVQEEGGRLTEFDNSQINNETSTVETDSINLQFPLPPDVGHLYILGLGPTLAVDTNDDSYQVISTLNGGQLVEGFSSTGKREAEGLENQFTQFNQNLPPYLTVDESTNDLYVDRGSVIAGYKPFLSPSLISPVVEFGAPGLSGGGGRGIAVNSSARSIYSNYIYVADTVASKVDIFVPEEPSLPAVTTGETPTRIGTDSSTVNATVNARGLNTSYFFQYGKTSCAKDPSSCSVAPSTSGTGIGSEFGAQSVGGLLQGLQPDTAYDYRVVAVNEKGTAYGAEATFTTYPVAQTALPDGRVYELVSQFGNQYSEAYLPAGEASITGEPGIDGSLLARPGITYEASGDGNVMTFAGSPYTTGGTGDTEGNPNQYLSSRLPQGGWTLANITPLGNYGSPYVGFTNDLSVGFLNANTETPFITTETPYERPPVEGGSESSEAYPELYRRGFTGADFRPIFSGPPYRPSGNHQGAFYVTYAGSSANGLEQLVESDEDLLEGKGPLEEELSSGVQEEGKEAKEVSKLTTEIENLKVEGEKLEEEEQYTAAEKKYEERNAKRTERKTKEENDDNNKLYAVASGKTVLVNFLPDGTIAQNATFGGNLDHVVSADGSRIFWTSTTGTIYVREDASRTIQVSQGPAEFWTASSDGKYAFYTEAGKLWRFDVESKTDVELARSSGGVQGVIGTNETGEDGAYVYFVAQEVLTSEENSAKQQAAEGGNNLYVYEPDSAHPGQSKIAFVGTLSSQDNADWASGLRGRLANLTPDGQGLVFASLNNLTGGSYSGEGSTKEVYVYDADNASVICASCRPQASGGHLIPSLTSIRTYRWISEDGDQVFFDSSAPLVGQDINGKQDVYEWERDGSNGCDEDDGCVYLLSNGVEGVASLIESSTSGNDVFIATRQRLIPELGNENEQIYDARVDGVLPVTPPQCSGTGCQGAPASAPIFATPASVTFEGVGNFLSPVPVKVTSKTRSLTRAQKLSRALSACRKKRGKKERAVCEVRARKLYGAKTKAKKTAMRRAK